MALAEMALDEMALDEMGLDEVAIPRYPRYSTSIAHLQSANYVWSCTSRFCSFIYIA